MQIQNWLMEMFKCQVKGKKSTRFVVKTPVGTAGVRGTEFEVSYSETDGMSIDVTSGAVDFTNNKNQKTSIRKGFKGK